MTRTPSEALDWAKREHLHRSRSWTGMCQMFVRSCYGVGSGFGSAAAAWNGANHKHPLTDGNRAPRGVPFFWHGGSRGFGHVAITVGNGLCWSTDIARTGYVDLAHINTITARWGQHPMGWTEDINNVRVWSMPTVSYADVASAAERDPGRSRTGSLTAGALNDVIRVERALAARGYLNPAYVDGSYGTKTVEAMHRYQRDHGMSGRGLPTHSSVGSVIKGRYRLID